MKVDDIFWKRTVKTDLTLYLRRTCTILLVTLSIKGRNASELWTSLGMWAWAMLNYTVCIFYSVITIFRRFLLKLPSSIESLSDWERNIALLFNILFEKLFGQNDDTIEHEDLIALIHDTLKDLDNNKVIDIPLHRESKRQLL